MQLDELLNRYDPLNHVHWLETKVFRNSLHDYVLTILTFIVLWLVLGFVRKQGVSRLGGLAESTGNKLIDFLWGLAKQIRPLSFATLAFYLATRRLLMAPGLDKSIKFLTLGVVTIQVVVLAGNLAGFLIRNSGVYKETDLVAENTARNLTVLIKTALWAGAILFLLDNAGVNISTFVAGLGISGVAIALAAQAILGDTFSSFAIALDKPFEVGDFIVVDALAGTVEHIGLKTTRVRSVNGELLIFANSDLTKSRIQNFKRMYTRRVNLKVQVDYATPLETMKKIPGMVKEIIESVPQTRFDRAHFQRFADWSLDYDVVYFVLSPEYNVFADIQQEIGFRIHECFARNGIRIPFPTSTQFQAHIEGKAHEVTGER